MEDKLYHYKARCVRVVDGDTYEISISLGMNVSVTEKVRLAGVDTSEIYGVKKGSDEYNKGIISKNFVSDLILDKEILIRTVKDKKGKYGRYIVYVEIDGEDLGDTLVKNGMAKYVTY